LRADAPKEIARVARFFSVHDTKTGKNEHKMYQTVINYTKRSQNIPNGHKIYQHCTFQGPPKYIQIFIFGLQISHLAAREIAEKSVFQKSIF
jgi:hypothetical protein